MFAFPLKMFILGYESYSNEWYWLTTDANINRGTANATIFIDLLTTEYKVSGMLGKNYAYRNRIKISQNKKVVNWYSSESDLYQYNRSSTNYFYFGIG